MAPTTGVADMHDPGLHQQRHGSYEWVRHEEGAHPGQGLDGDFVGPQTKRTTVSVLDIQAVFKN